MKYWIHDEELPPFPAADKWERVAVDAGDDCYRARPLFQDYRAARPVRFPADKFRGVHVHLGDIVHLDADRNVIELRRPAVTLTAVSCSVAADPLTLAA